MLRTTVATRVSGNLSSSPVRNFARCRLRLLSSDRVAEPYCPPGALLSEIESFHLFHLSRAGTGGPLCAFPRYDVAASNGRECLAHCIADVTRFTSPACLSVCLSVCLS